ncbi:MAG TPA: type IV toxin-antitoxin system AbiEi family antitoxin [Microbacteriaceae bacterium]
MTRLLPDVLIPAATLPLPELCAARLDGEVMPIDECFIAIDTAITPGARAATLRSLVGSRAIAEKTTALWIYGILPSPPAVHTVCVDRADRSAAPHSLRVTVAQSRFRPGDLCTIGGIAVTTPLRTVYDLARARRFTPLESDGIHALIERFALDEVSCIARIDAVRNLPGRRAALRRLHAGAANAAG